MSHPLRLDGDVVLVTGAGRGLGESYARYIAKLGAHVIVNDLGVDTDGTGRSGAPARAVADAIVADGGSASSDHSDVASAAEARALVARIIADHGRIDAVINNAGNFPAPADIADTPFEAFESTWYSHLGSTLHLCQAILPHMRAANYGRIVNTNSTQSLYGGTTSPAYAAAKGAVQGLTLSIAGALRGSGVTANCLSPGAFTRMVDRTERPPEFTASLRRNLAPGLVAPLAAWLCHRDCTENGAVLQGMAGWFSRTLTGDLAGFWDFDPTIESVAQGLAALSGAGAIEGAADSSSHAARIVALADARRNAA